ncbi:MAG TPA: hypothetical protein VE685_05065 [Thermoanaerobaculia bacterium]|nr:hypothetical protein [Thermoanaerobaculia bacterium]
MIHSRAPATGCPFEPTTRTSRSVAAGSRTGGSSPGSIRGTRVCCRDAWPGAATITCHIPASGARIRKRP